MVRGALWNDIAAAAAAVRTVSAWVREVSVEVAASEVGDAAVRSEVAVVVVGEDGLGMVDLGWPGLGCLVAAAAAEVLAVGSQEAGTG